MYNSKKYWKTRFLFTFWCLVIVVWFIIISNSNTELKNLKKVMPFKGYMISIVI